MPTRRPPRIRVCIYCREDDTAATVCRFPGCPKVRAGNNGVLSVQAPMCEEHMVEAWRWIEHRSALNPTAQHNAAREIEAEQQRWDALPRLVYYMQLRHGAIKIGTTSDLPQRTKQLRLDWPGSVLAAEPGGYDIEKSRHRQFNAEQHLTANGHRLEDFEPSDELLAHIERVRRQHGDPSKLQQYLWRGRWDYDTA